MARISLRCDDAGFGTLEWTREVLISAGAVTAGKVELFDTVLELDRNRASRIYDERRQGRPRPDRSAKSSLVTCTDPLAKETQH